MMTEKEKHPDSNSSTPSTEYTQCLIDMQSRLYAYILSMAGNSSHAHDILQETNLLLLQKSDKFTSGTNFGAWACRVAYNQVRKYRLTQSRNRLVFDDQTLSMMADAASTRTEPLTDKLIALTSCLEQLQPKHRELIQKRYSKGETVSSVAQDVGRAADSVKVTLSRIRVVLLKCIQLRLSKQVSS